MLKIDISRRASKFLKKLSGKHARQVGLKVHSLRSNPEPTDSIILKDLKPLRRADIGEYRIIYFVKSEVLYIVLIGKRNDNEVYKQLK